jgi:hypothetical protein
VLADALGVGEAAVGKPTREIGMTLGVGRGTDILAVRVAGRNEGTAFRSEVLVRGGAAGAGFVDSQCKWCRALDLVVGLPVGVDEVGVDDRVREQKKPS